MSFVCLILQVFFEVYVHDLLLLIETIINTSLQNMRNYLFYIINVSCNNVYLSFFFKQSNIDYFTKATLPLPKNLLMVI